MAWGYRWQAMYDPVWNGPAQQCAFANVLHGTTVLDSTVIGNQQAGPVSVRWHRNAQLRRFERCDFNLALIPESFVTNCEFLRCRFRGSSWDGVRFSNCRFERCDFSETRIVRCYFVDNCEFIANTASPQKFRIEETAISASSFLNGLEPNLAFEAPDLIPYSTWKFVETRHKIAKALFSATRDEPEVDYYFQAYEQLTRCTLNYRVERHRFNDVTKQRNFRAGYWLWSLPARIDRTVVLLSGSITKWGRSICPALCVFVAIVILFSAVYLISLDQGASSTAHHVMISVRTALNITLVAGYTAEFHHGMNRLMQAMMVLNVVAGLAWYSLVIPALTRRILR
jgi:hypothetical protein